LSLNALPVRQRTEGGSWPPNVIWSAGKTLSSSADAELTSDEAPGDARALAGSNDAKRHVMRE
jgi:hypothetical protein